MILPEDRLACSQAHKMKAAGRKAAEEAMLSGVWTMPDTGAASPTHMVGNLAVAGKVSSEAVRMKSHIGARRLTPMPCRDVLS